jgi:hypothetical protein
LTVNILIEFVNTNMAMERNFEVVPDRFQISEISATKKLRTKRDNPAVSSTGVAVVSVLEARTEEVPSCGMRKR